MLDKDVEVEMLLEVSVTPAAFSDLYLFKFCTDSTVTLFSLLAV